MRITPLADVAPRPRRVAVGTFDGVHLGHREVIRGADTVVTFDPHPSSVIAPAGAPRLITTLERKAELIAGLGVDELVVIPFDDSFAAQSPQAFIDEILVATLGATHVSVGENFRFGHRAGGDPALLAADERFETRVVELLESEGEVVSSSHIRGLLLSGAVEEADRLLGDAFQLSGPVVHGDARGRTLGYPTANLVPREGYVCPGHGVYACRVAIGPGPDAELWLAAAVNVGVRPQFATGRQELVEAYLLDFEGDLYDTPLRIEFLRRMRGERRFPTVDDLVAQMGRDVEQARTIALRDPC
jgi:riboflavin kinase/FMN adenylyltransferase